MEMHIEHEMEVGLIWVQGSGLVLRAKMIGIECSSYLSVLYSHARIIRGEYYIRTGP